MTILDFVFFKMIEDIEINSSLRVSVWCESKKNYLMPCRFIEVLNESNAYALKVEVLDPLNFMQGNYIDKKFYFGHPAKIIGYGILKRNSSMASTEKNKIPKV